jgi:hypothetical protein
MAEVNRRTEDSRINQVVNDVSSLTDDVAGLKTKMEMIGNDLKRNNEVTEQVRDLVGSIRMSAAIGKWVAAVGAGVVAVWQGIDLWRR